MSTTSIIVTAIIVVIGVIFVLDRAKRSGSKSKSRKKPTNRAPQQNIPITADESGPTQTGRFRVQEMLNRTKQNNASKTASAAATTTAGESSDPVFDDDEELPDPFNPDD